MDTINYNIIDNIPQKNMNNIDIDKIKINEMIIGYDTIQKSSNLDRTNKYDLEIIQEQIPVIVKKNNNNNIKKNGYIVVLDNGDTIDKTQQEDYMINPAFNTNKDKDKDKNNNKMSTFTTFYVGSLTIVGLFIFYRLIQKTK